jgi:hypothetical protein
VTFPKSKVTLPPLVGVGKTPFTDPTAPLTSATGMLETVVNGEVPLPLIYPVRVVAPVPPLETGMTGRVVVSTFKELPVMVKPVPKVISVAAELPELDPLS